MTLGTPAVIHDRSGHVAVVNSAAAELLKIKGSPDGILVERQDALSRVPRLEIGELKRIAVKVFAEWREMGVVAITDATHTNDQSSLDVLADISKECGGPHITAMIGADRLGDLRFGETYKGIEIGHAKVMPDVGLQQDLTKMVATAHRAGFPVAVHVMDIDMLDETLLALETSPPPPSTTDRLEHCSLAMPEQLD